MTTVYFAGSNHRLEVRRGCKACGVTQKDIERFVVVVSPSGIAHYTNEYGDTDCGRDATRSGWWWKS